MEVVNSKPGTCLLDALAALLSASRKGVQAAKAGTLLNSIPAFRLRLLSTGGRLELTLNPKIVRSGSVMAIALTLAFALAGCSVLSKHNQASVSTDSTGNSVGMRQVSDDLGRQIQLPVRLERVVTLAPNLTEIVFAVGAGNRLVGDTEYCDYPVEAKAIAKVGDTLHPNIERVLALQPQLVLVSTSSQLEFFVSQLNDEKIAVYVTDPKDLAGVFTSIERIGYILGEQEKSKALVRSLKQRAQALEDAVRITSPVTVFCQLSSQPLYTAGKDAFVTDLIGKAGGVSVTREVPGAWPRFSDEAALASRPQSIIVATSGTLETNEAEVAAPLRKSPAVVNGRVYKINADYLMRPGPRLVDGLEQIARALHPEAFR